MTDPSLTRVRRRFVALTWLRWFPTGVVLPVLVLLMRERGLDLATIGLLLGVYSLVTAALELPTGGLADVLGRRPVLVLSATLSVAAAVLLAVGQSVLVLGSAFAVLGVARALDSGPLQAWYVDSVHAVDPRADLRPGLSWAGAAEAGGLCLGALVGGALVQVSPFAADAGVLIPLSTPFLVAAVLSAVHLCAAATWVREPVGRRPAGLAVVLGGVPRTIARGGALALGPGPLRRLMIVTAALGVVLAGVELLTPTSVAALLGGESEAAAPYAVLVTIGFAGTSLGSAVAPVVARIAGSSVRALVGVGIVAALALLGVAAPTLGVASTAYVAFYLLLGVGSPLLDELTHASVASGERATVLSVRSMVGQVGGLVAGLGIGALAGATSLTAGFAVLAVVLLLGSLALVRLPSVGDRRTEPATADRAGPDRDADAAEVASHGV